MCFMKIIVKIKKSSCVHCERFFTLVGSRIGLFLRMSFGISFAEVWFFPTLVCTYIYGTRGYKIQTLIERN